MTKTIIAALVGVAFVTGGALLLPATQSSAEEAQSTIELGKALAFDRKKGNCLACHMMGDGDLAGNIGPVLIAMQQRFPDKAVLRAQIWDSTVKNRGSVMPPFGRHRMLTDEEIDLITDYVHTL
ncbi:MAG: sulfur oxidation c-type cytochrome SoxX [Woeseiaceae bacterium]